MVADSWRPGWWLSPPDPALNGWSGSNGWLGTSFTARPPLPVGWRTSPPSSPIRWPAPTVVGSERSARAARSARGGPDVEAAPTADPSGRGGWVGPQPGRLGRDYGRIDTNDHSAEPQLIGTLIDVHKPTPMSCPCRLRPAHLAYLAPLAAALKSPRIFGVAARLAYAAATPAGPVEDHLAAL